MNIKWSRVVGFVVILLLLFGVYYVYKNSSKSISGKKEITVDDEKGKELLDKVQMLDHR